MDEGDVLEHMLTVSPNLGNPAPFLQARAGRRIMAFGRLGDTLLMHPTVVLSPGAYLVWLAARARDKWVI